MSEFPRLALVSDVTPARTQGGELLLYRLLEDYPADRLRVVHAGKSPWFELAKGLPGVRHELVEYDDTLPVFVRRHWVTFWRTVELELTKRHSRRVAAALADFRPEVVLTVTDFSLWRAAAAYARRARLPLLLVQHDDLACKMTDNGPKIRQRFPRWLVERQLGSVYRQAAARFCVSPGMAERYRQKFGAVGEVIYPSRGKDSIEPKVRVRPDGSHGPVVAFGGALYTEGGRELIRRLAEILEGIGGRVDLYTQDSMELIRRIGLERPGVRVVGFLPAAEMARRMAETADALFLPASFYPNEAFDVSTLFPSKLADYTAVGLPVLIWGPEYSSAVQWGVENPGASILVTDPSGASLPQELSRLVTDKAWAAGIATAGVAAGLRYFTAASAQRTLLAALNRPNRGGP